MSIRFVPSPDRLTRHVALVATIAVAGVACAGTPSTHLAPDQLAAAAPASGAVGAAEPVEPVWHWEAPAGATVGAPAADRAGVAITVGVSEVVLLGPDGELRWRTPHLGVRDAPPLLTADVVVVPTDDGLLALDRADGRRRWVVGLGGRTSTPVAVAGLAVATTWEGVLAGVDLARGEVMWSEPLPGAALGPPAAGEGVAVASWDAGRGRGAGLVAVDARTGTRRWAAALPDGAVSGPAVATGPAGSARVVTVAGDVAAHAHDLRSGRPLWRVETTGAGAPEVPPLPLAGGAVLVAGRLTDLTVVEGSGAVRWAGGGSGGGVVVRGGPAGPGPHGGFALPVDEGLVLLDGPGGGHRTLDPPGRVTGVARLPGGAADLLLVATRDADRTALLALDGW